ncbi:hypothetical protein OCHUTO_0332 [Orientia chuto str. Dubai]|uniref:Uncharacterized protein n=1 Tax=Orientia chuto str. Dubai TaxID=1359168 RepID=A0A0F3MM77_9RICK|nr:hypothetical protein OCHUTO_0332 [Orientia chuto str. Dubai]
MQKFSNGIDLAFVESNSNLQYIEYINQVVNYPTIILANEFFDSLPIKYIYKRY